jgi:hypothetical protein
MPLKAIRGMSRRAALPEMKKPQAESFFKDARAERGPPVPRQGM